MRLARRITLAVGAAAVLAVAGPAYSQGTGDTETGGCDAVFAGVPETMLKQHTGRDTVRYNGDGTYTLTYDLVSRVYYGTSSGVPGDVHDCVWVDQDGDEQYDPGEPLFGSQERLSFHQATSSSVATRPRTSIVALPGDVVCDKARSVFTDVSGTEFTEYSNVLCIQLPLEGEVFVPAGGPIGAVLIAAGSGVLLLRRARRRRAT
jgi:hypothetical protein